MMRPVVTVALDTSQIGDLARDHTSTSKETRLHAGRFETTMLANGFVPLLCWHHMEELIQHADDTVVARRLAYLRARPAIAWITHADGSPGLGTVVDLLAAEARTALDRKLDARAVRDAVRRTSVRFGTGAEALAPHEDAWPLYRTLARERAEHARMIVAVTRGQGIPDVSGMRVLDLAASSSRALEDFETAMSYQEQALAADIAARGDRRIGSPVGEARGFYQRVRGEAAGLRTPSTNPILDDLHRRGARPGDIGPETTVGEILRLLEFRGKIDAAQMAVTEDICTLKERSDMGRLPTWIIENGLATHG